jgi:hypothetical protein
MQPGTGILTPQFFFDIKSELEVIQENSYAEFLDSEANWWTYIAKLKPCSTSKLIVQWLLETAFLELLGTSTDIPARELSLATATFIPQNTGARIVLSMNDFTDTDKNGLDVLKSWVTQVSAESAYFPQEQIGSLLLSGTAAASALATYDGANYFSTAHPYNPNNLANGYYANLFTGTAGTGGANAADPGKAMYPGAVPVGTGVTLDVALANLVKIFGYIAGIKQANGRQPRRLRPWAILSPSALYARINSALETGFVGGSTGGQGGGSGSNEFRGQIQKLGYAKNFLCPEFDSEPTNFYVIVKQVATSQLGGVVWSEREPVGINTYFPQSGQNVDIARSNTCEGIARGRATPGYGHPFLIFKCCGS